MSLCPEEETFEIVVFYLLNPGKPFLRSKKDRHVFVPPVPPLVIKITTRRRMSMSSGTVDALILSANAELITGD